MHNISLIEDCYRKFIKSINYWIPDGVNFVNLDLLHHYDLLHFLPSYRGGESELTRYFQIIESPEKITLINDEFVIWIIPDRLDNMPITYTLIALNHVDREPELEMAFVSSGVYNTSKLVLKVLEKFLIEIQENEHVISTLR